MNYWWVNQSQTFRHEFFGKYIWSPKKKRNDQINPFYETMREVAPGDIVFSFVDGAIQGFGMARTHCYTSPRPDEFGHIGQAWNEVGWRADVDFQRFTDSSHATHAGGRADFAAALFADSIERPRQPGRLWLVSCGNRDRVVNRALRRAGWRVLRIWEHELPRLKAKC